ncbi:MAG: DUF5103 domain-containing protein [Runella slithyformis]|nr:MAG: DUF5103 domain-containing protein [Runella slithyformis]
MKKLKNKIAITSPFPQAILPAKCVLLSALLLFNLPLLRAQRFANLRYEDATYEPNIKTAAVYPAPNNPNDPARTLLPPVTSLEDAPPLIAEFDDLGAQFRNFRFKIFHCNANWQPSNLSDIEFTYEYNDYAIQQYQASFNTKIPFYHYRFELPKLKLSGNYVLAVYEDTRPAKLAFTRRFMHYQSRVGITPQVRISTGIGEQFTHQQIDFDVDYKGYEVLSPQEDLKIVVRQNFQWAQVLNSVKASNVRIFENRIEFRPFDLSNNMPGGNEYRWFDTRVAQAVGMRVSEVQQLPNQNVARLRPDASRNGGTYLQADDFNGNYVVLNRESENSTNEADYINVVFTLQVPEQPNAQMYVSGAFNLWQRTEANRMTYNANQNAYEASIFIKQGVVNYTYILTDSSGKVLNTSLEGNYSSTANDYEIFVYHRPPAARADQLVGYRLVEFGRR